MARTGALEASSEGSIPSSPTRRSDGTVDVLRSERSVLMGVWVRIPPSALLPLPVEPDVGLRSRQVEFDSRLGLTACQSRRSARLPVTEEITGSSPVQAAWRLEGEASLKPRHEVTPCLEPRLPLPVDLVPTLRRLDAEVRFLSVACVGSRSGQGPRL